METTGSDDDQASGPAGGQSRGDGRGGADEGHPLLAVMAALESVLDEAELDDRGRGISALSHEQLREVASRSWRMVQRLYGAVVLPVVAEADERRLFRKEPYASDSSMGDLIAGWLRCDPAVARRLLYTAKHCTTGGFRQTGAALAAGDIDVEHATETIRSVRGLPAGVMQEQDYRQAESTMVQVAKMADATVTKLAGRRLLEVLAPDAAQQHADRQAERERERAEASRWFEVAGVGIAGSKEIRLRAESEVIDTLMRVLTGLVQPSPVDAAPGGPPDADARPDTGPYSDGGTEAGTAPDTDAGPDRASNADTAAGVGADAAAWAGGEAGTDTHTHAGGEAGGGGTGADVDGVKGETGDAAPGGAPGAEAEGGVTLAPIERRRADAAVEVIDALSRPDLLDDLTAAQLRHLADLLDADPTETGPATAGLPTNDSAPLSSASLGLSATGHASAEQSGGAQPSAGAEPLGVAARTVAATWDRLDPAVMIDDEIDPSLAAAVDAGHVTVDDCAEATSEAIDEATNKDLHDVANDPADDSDDREGSDRRGTGQNERGTCETNRGDRGARGTDRNDRDRGDRDGTCAIPMQPNRAIAKSGRDAGPAARTASDLRPTQRVRGARPSLVILANYDHDRGRPHAGEASSTGAPARLVSRTEIERTACEATITPVWMTNNTTPASVAAPTRFFRRS